MTRDGGARRSVLFTPGDESEMMRKALGGDADVVVFDLEDAVAPDEKAKAREAVDDALGDVPEDAPEIWVRLNPFGDGRGTGTDGRDDLDALDHEPSCYVVPKAGSAADVERVAEALDERGSDAGLVPIVESASGVINAGVVADAPRVSAVVFGAEDLTADLGATRTEEGDEVVYARQKVVTAATAAGVDAIDTLWTDFRDEEGLRRDTERGIGLGYDGKLAIHPAQVAVINEAFTPDPRRVEWAERILEAKEEADERGKGVFEVDGEMVDAPLVGQARTVRERARAAGVWSSG
jgi:citrate lyase subunit beta/citryl-CoA lyase